MDARAETPSVASEFDRIRYVVKGGTIQRNYDDGSTTRYTYKTGDVVYADQPADKQKYAIKNNPPTVKLAFMRVCSG